MKPAKSRLVAALMIPGLLCAFAGRSAPGSRFTVPRVDMGPVLARVEASGRPLALVEGEVISAGGNRCLLRTGGSERSFTLRAGCPVFANGMPACLEAIRPVAPGAFFWAGLWLDRAGAPFAVEAVYCGGELVLTAVTPTHLAGVSPETGGIVVLPVIAGLACPARGTVYVLLDLNGRVRWLREYRCGQEMLPALSK